MLDYGSRNYSIKSMEGSEQIIYCRAPLSAASQSLFLFLTPASDTCDAQGHYTTDAIATYNLLNVAHVLRSYRGPYAYSDLCPKCLLS